MNNILDAFFLLRIRFGARDYMQTKLLGPPWLEKCFQDGASASLVLLCVTLPGVLTPI